jgi:hypothetical protein
LPGQRGEEATVPSPHLILPRNTTRTLLLGLAVLMALTTAACGTSRSRARAHIRESSTQPRIERFKNINATPAAAAVEAPEHATRTAADDLPCAVTATWLRDILPADEVPADWGRPLAKWTRERAVAILLTADRVRGPSVGPKGHVPPQVWAMIVLSRQSDLACTAAWLLKRALLPGRIYALGALRLADPEHFETLSVDYNQLPAPVPVTFGLVDGEARVVDLVARIRSGELPQAWQQATEPLMFEDEGEP